MKPVRPRQFLVALLAIYAALAGAIAVNYAVLWRAGELAPLADIVARQRRDGAIYNALSIGFADYKYAAYRRAAPQIVAIGTSRAMQLRQRAFLEPFYNLGGLTQGPAQADVLADRLLLQGQPPALMIFALDFWTFCRPPTAAADRAEAGEFHDGEFHDGMGQPPRNFLIYRLLMERRFALADFARLLRSSGAADVDRIGIGARLGSSGFAADGSLYARGPDPALAARWREMLARLDAGTDQFVKGCAVSNAALAALERFVGRMEAAGSRVVLLLAPLPGAVLARMAADGGYAYVDRLRGILAARFPERFLDCLDMRDSAPDSEFLDGLHGGEITYMRAILAAAQRPGAALRGFLDEAFVMREIERWGGQAQIGDDPITQRFFPVE